MTQRSSLSPGLGGCIVVALLVIGALLPEYGPLLRAAMQRQSAAAEPAETAENMFYGPHGPVRG